MPLGPVSSCLRQESKGLVARNDLAVCVPPARTADRVGIDAPADVVSAPERVHGPEVSVLTLEVKDEPLRRAAIGCKERLELGDCELGLAAKLDEDWGVERRLFKLADSELDLLRRLDFEAQELGLEVFPHPSHPGFLEVLLRGGNCRFGKNHHSADDGENRLEDDPALPTDETEEVLPTAHAVDTGFRLPCGHVAVLGHDNLPSAESQELPSTRGCGGLATPCRHSSENTRQDLAHSKLWRISHK